MGQGDNFPHQINVIFTEVCILKEKVGCVKFNTIISLGLFKNFCFHPKRNLPILPFVKQLIKHVQNFLYKISCTKLFEVPAPPHPYSCILSYCYLDTFWPI